jgi:Ni2+-binding GTPase involved in maturation of urease and hydrogenase
MTTLLTIGGFLGAGKTTLIAAAARRLTEQGRRVVVVTNDQAPDLVDTALVRMTGVPTAEVAGACFCCAFNDFAARTDELIAAHRPDVILAEPVGSCVDIAATVLRPLERERAQLRIAPFTVCVDPAAWQAVEDGRMPPDTAYIHRLQTMEADILLITKSDEASPDALDLLGERLTARNPAAEVMHCSAASGTGVEAWLAAVESGPAGGGQRIAVDYDRYAAGEAALGWLNAAVTLTGGHDWPSVLLQLMRAVSAHLPPAHLKCLLESGELTLVANSVTGRPEPALRTLHDGAASVDARLTINARIAIDAQELRSVVTAALATLPVPSQVRTIRAFPPGRPVPVHRLP